MISALIYILVFRHEEEQHNPAQSQNVHTLSVSVFTQQTQNISIQKSINYLTKLDPEVHVRVVNTPAAANEGSLNTRSERVNFTF